MYPRFRTTAAVRRSVDAFRGLRAAIKEKRSGKTSRSGLQAVPQGRPEALFERPSLFRGKVRHREAQVRAGTARAITADQSSRLWIAVARKAKGEAHVRAAGTAIP